MSHKKWMAVALLATAAVSTTAVADNRGVNTAVGAVLGAVIGNSVGGQDGAMVGGLLGAVVGASASSGRDRGYDRRHYERGPNVHYREPVYYQPAPRGHYSYQGDYRYDRRDYHDSRRANYSRHDRDYYRR